MSQSLASYRTKRPYTFRFRYSGRTSFTLLGIQSPTDSLGFVGNHSIIFLHGASGTIVRQAVSSDLTVDISSMPRRFSSAFHMLACMSLPQ